MLPGLLPGSMTRSTYSGSVSPYLCQRHHLDRTYWANEDKSIATLIGHASPPAR